MAVIVAPAVGTMERAGDSCCNYRGKVDTAEMGVGGDFECSTVAPLDKIDPPFPYVVVCTKLK